MVGYGLWIDGLIVDVLNVIIKEKMGKLENQEVSSYFQDLEEQLKTIYEDREATTIARYIFEDAFGIVFPLSKGTGRILGEEETKLYHAMVQDLLQKRPWQYVLGTADFYGLKFIVNENVLIPRPETEELVHEIIQRHKQEPIELLDIGTGSGCIAVTLQQALSNAKVTAVDVSKGALEVAAQNAIKHKVSPTFQQVNILEAEASQKMPKYHVIVSNPPYIQDTEKAIMPEHVLAHEPHLALFVTNKDALQFYKIIADFALRHLYTKGWLYFEINEYFGSEVLQLLKNRGFTNCALLQDMFGRDRIVLGQLPANADN